MATTSHPHVALLAFPFASHPASLHTLACLLASAAPTTTFSFLTTAIANASLSHLQSPPNLRFHNVRDGLPNGHVSAPWKTDEEIGFFMNMTPGNFQEGLEKVGKVSCLVSDCFLWFGGELAEAMGVPWVALWTAGAASFFVHVHTDLLRDTLGVHNRVLPEHGDQSLDFIPGLSSLRVRDLPEGVVSGDLTSPISILLHKMGQNVRNATAVVLNTFEALEADAIADLNSKFNSIIPIGPLNLIRRSLVYEDNHKCLSWLDRQTPASVAYIAFGTITTLPRSELTALADALEHHHVPFLWSLKENLHPTLPEGFLRRTSEYGLVVPWAPQLTVMRHPAIGVYVTHGGWNSTTENFAAGVPMVCRPFFADQRLNARKAAHVWGTGIAVGDEGLTKEWTGQALERVLRTEEGERMRERGKVLMELAGSAVGDKGSSVRNLDKLVELVCRV